MSRRANGEGCIYYYAPRDCFRAQITIGKYDNGKKKVKAFYGKTKKEVKEKMETYKLLNPINKAAINEYTVATWFNYWLWNIKKEILSRKPLNVMSAYIETISKALKSLISRYISLN